MRIIVESIMPPKVPKLCSGAEGDNETLSQLDVKHWSKIRTNASATSNVIDRLIKSYPQASSKLSKVRDTLTKSCITYGLMPDTNKFLALVASPMMKQVFNPGHYQILYDMWDKDEISLNLDYLVNPSLYARNAKDFRYTVSLFDTVNNPDKLKKFFPNADGISQLSLFEAKYSKEQLDAIKNRDPGVSIQDVVPKGISITSSNIKPVGTPSDDIRTLAGTVESWSNSTKNDKPNGGVESSAVQTVANDKSAVIDTVKRAIANKTVSKTEIQSVIR